MNYRSLMKKLVTVVAPVVFTVSFSAHVVAGPIPANLQIEGSVIFDEEANSGTQGSFGILTSGGSATIEHTYVDGEPGSGSTIEFGPEVINQSGDGFFLTGTNSEELNNEFYTAFSSELWLENTSDSLTYEISFLLSMDYSLNSSGEDAYSSLFFELINTNTNETDFEFFIASNTAADNGNEVDEFVGLVEPEGGVDIFELIFTLNPLEELSFDLFWEMDGFSNDGFALSDVVTNFTLQDAKVVSEVPEPAAWAIMLLGLTGIAWRKNAQK
jgi:hypothetical protein